MKRFLSVFAASAIALTLLSGGASAASGDTSARSGQACPFRTAVERLLLNGYGTNCAEGNCENRETVYGLVKTLTGKDAASVLLGLIRPQESTPSCTGEETCEQAADCIGDDCEGNDCTRTVTVFPGGILELPSWLKSLPVTVKLPQTSPVKENNGATETHEAPSTAMSAEQRAVWELVNAYRAENGLGKVSFDASLSGCASTRAIEAASVFSHTRPNGTRCFTVLDEAGVSYRSAGENIAKGQRSAEEVMKDWMNSEGHRANILNPSFTKLGVGVYTDAYGTITWTQMFTY